MPTHNTPDLPFPSVEGADQPTPPGTPRRSDTASDVPDATDQPAAPEPARPTDDTMILAAPYPATAPMRMPEDTWAMLITGVDINDHGDHRADEVELFTGCWQPTPTPASGDYAGDLVVRLAPPASTGTAQDPSTRVDVEMALAYQDQWHHVGRWPALGPDWPHIIAATAQMIMCLHTDLPDTGPPSRPGQPRA